MMNTEDFNELFDNELHLAVRVSDIESTKKALEQGYNPNAIGLFEWSAVHEAAHNGEYKILKLLLKHGGDPNHQDYLNRSTALHYAATEGHPMCLELLLSRGGDPKIKNEKGQTFPQMTRQKACKDVLSKFGIDVTTSVHFEESSPKPISTCNTIPETSSTSLTAMKHSDMAAHPPSSFSTKAMSKSCISDGSFESGIGSRTSLSDTASVSSAACRSPVLRGGPRSYLSDQPSSPCKSYSSLGSLTSIGSSIISGSDDCAGYITMAFQYNSKTSQLKIRITEIVLTCLLPYQKVKKDTSLHLHVSGKIYSPNEINLKYDKVNNEAKSESFRLQPGGDQDNPVQEKDGSVKTYWRERDAKVTFLTALMVEFPDVKKDFVKDRNIQVSICAKQKKNVLKKNLTSTFATLDLSLKDAVKHLMKETYELQPCHVHGITRNQEKLEQVLSEMIIDSGKPKCASVYSDSNIRGRINETFELELVERSVSDGDLKQVTTQSPITTSLSSSCYDVEEQSEMLHGLQGVQSHLTPESPQVKVKMAAANSEKSTVIDRREAKMDMPPFSEKTLNGKGKKELLRKARGKMHQVATGSAKSLHRLVVSKNQTEIENISIDEEQRLGFPQEVIQLDTFSNYHGNRKKTDETEFSFLSDERVDKKVLCPSPRVARDIKARSHVRTSSSDSFTKVDESLSSPSRCRRNLKRDFLANVDPSRHPNSPNAHVKNSDCINAQAKPSLHSVLTYEDTQKDNSYSQIASPWLVESK